MKKLLTGYVVNFNLRHKRTGHLFQNRYKSVICEEDPYLLELTRYIHLNPLRVGMVGGVEGLNNYPWAGHSAIMGRVERKWHGGVALGDAEEKSSEGAEDVLSIGSGENGLSWSPSCSIPWGYHFLSQLLGCF
jgi:hypothetical protein